LNERMRRGVTPENNANVLIWKALGPRPERRPPPPEFFELMGIEAPPEKGDYFINLPRYVKEKLEIDSAEESKEIDDQVTPSMRRTWTPTEQTKLATWLKANEK